MAEDLGTLEDLPPDYVAALAEQGVLPLWPSLRRVLPYGLPERRTRPFLWRYGDIRPSLLRAGDLTPIEKAERRVLVLANPGLGIDNIMATPTIYLGLQLILPGDTAPNHRHTPSAVRFVVEGDGAYTTVEGEKCPMEKGDLILTPAGMWHDHGHAGAGPVVWLDALDLPLIYRLEASYAIEGEVQTPANAPDRSQTTYRRAGLVPYAAAATAGRAAYPLLRYPWREVRQALLDLAAGSGPDEPVHLAYANPENGAPCLPVMGFSAQMLRPAEEVAPTPRSASAVFHVVEGEGVSKIDGETLAWGEADTVAIPTHAQVRHRAGTDGACLFHVDDAPLHQALGIYEEFEAAP